MKNSIIVAVCLSLLLPFIGCTSGGGKSKPVAPTYDVSGEWLLTSIAYSYSFSHVELAEAAEQDARSIYEYYEDPVLVRCSQRDLEFKCYVVDDVEINVEGTIKGDEYFYNDTLSYFDSGYEVVVKEEGVIVLNSAVHAEMETERLTYLKEDDGIYANVIVWFELNKV